MTLIDATIIDGPVVVDLVHVSPLVVQEKISLGSPTQRNQAELSRPCRLRCDVPPPAPPLLPGARPTTVALLSVVALPRRGDAATSFLSAALCTSRRSTTQRGSTRTGESAAHCTADSVHVPVDVLHPAFLPFAQSSPSVLPLPIAFLVRSCRLFE